MRAFTLLDFFAEDGEQIVADTVCRFDGGHHKHIGVDMREMESVAIMLNQFGKKDSLRSAVAFPKRMQVIGGLIQIHNFCDKPILG